MKRLLAAAVTAAALVQAAPAQAAADPATALKRQLVPGHGVTISETMRITSDHPDDAEVVRITGSVEFGTSGPVASDVVFRMTDGTKTSRLRCLSVGGRYYLRTTELSGTLPMGKTWVLMDGLEGAPIVSDQPVDVLAPKVIRTLLAHASLKNGLHRGSLTMAQARTIGGTGAFGYRLGLNSAALPVRVDSEQKITADRYWIRSVVETRLSGWGAKVSVKEPPADEVISLSELADEEVAKLDQLFKDIPDGSTSSLGQFR
ncbi:hypothetical protein ACFFV7_37725 [Nonomuraea spiralis]|uniref:Lipoprotein n=1 Tax=Nonomuraea spiralis TaxID=46182 RepID=A0ABV5IR36_9ACTN|nr:hypothetical protein [Nonomuraea spiralis]GGT23986.1 hypothetical protein GCM10010176_080590 [Nonomuraea spiralis]